MQGVWTTKLTGAALGTSLPGAMPAMPSDANCHTSCVIAPASPMKEEGPLEGRQSPPWGEKSVNSLAGSRRVAFLGWGALETPQWGCSKMTPERPVSVWLHQGRPPIVNPERSEWGVQESRHAVDGVFDQTARPSHPWGLGWEGPCSWLSGPPKDVPLL